MSISVPGVPANTRVPVFAVAFDNSQAQQGAALLAYRVLLLGQKISGGTATANTLQKVTSADQVATLAGRGSLLHREALAYFANNSATEAWIGVLADDVAGVAATGTLTVTGPATASGTLYLYVGGTRVTVGVTSGDTASTIAAAIVAAITANTNLPVTASAASGVVTVTARNKGLCGNGIDLRLNYQDGETTPAGVAVAVVGMASGATNPDLSGLIAVMGDTWFHVIVNPYTDATSLTALETELARRAGPMVQADGVAVTSAAGTHAALSTLGDTRNSQFTVIVGQPGKSPITPPAEFAAAVAGVLALNAPADPARPLQTLSVAGVLPPAQSDLFTLQERNLALFDGIASTRVAAGGVVQIERLITTYKTNAAGSADTSYLDLTSVLTLMYLRSSFRAQMVSRFPRHKLASDATRFGAGQPIVTPAIAKAEAIAWFRAMEELGLVEDGDAFKANLIVERDPSDPNRLNFLLPPNLVNSLIVGAANIQFQV